jgi:hypothetical protein
MKRSEKILLSLLLLALLGGVCADFFDIAWGTGNDIGRMSLTWAGISFIFFTLCLSLFFVLTRIFWRDDLSAQTAKRLVGFRSQLRWGRWALAAFVLIFPAWFLQFTVLGVVFQGFFLRVGLWVFALALASFLLAREDAPFVEWEGFLWLTLVTAALFAVLASLKSVTNYPFSLGWSEGNRLWDYSILFGSGRYAVPPGQRIPVFLDMGRQIVGGIPFLFPGLTIGQERLWLGLISILPYLLLGLAAFRSFVREKYTWLALVFWTFLFLKQGPIGIPLILCAVLVALAWRSELWLSIALLVFATDAAYTSRYTWVFAPGMWFFMLELFDGLQEGENKVYLTQRARFLLWLLAFGGVGGLLFLGLALGAYFQLGWAQNLPDVFFSLASALGRASQQPLLWYRLLPNETYESGILPGTAIAVLPLAAVLLYQVRSGKWKINGWQKLVVVLPLPAFFAVGLIVSAKIGGGGDLHNMDMFLVGLFLAAALLLLHHGTDWMKNTRSAPLWVRAALVLAIAIPGVSPLLELRSYEFGAQASRLATLTDSPNERALEMYPSDEIVENSLAVIQAEADAAKTSGGVLFMDQRQLLTFGYIQNVPLIPQYDKKVLMDQALASDEPYFQAFYADLAARRFSLIVTHPLIVKSQGTDEFGEENNAWVKWVSKPLLCFYEVKQTLTDVNVQLLVPKAGKVDCEKAMP